MLDNENLTPEQEQQLLLRSFRLEKDKIPALVKHAQKFYDALLHESQTEVIGGEPCQVFRGGVTKVYNTTGVSLGYYSKVIALLNDTECVEFIQRGTRLTESVLVLLRSPMAASAAGLLDTSRRGVEGLTSTRLADRLAVDVDNLKRQLGGLHVPSLALNLERRLVALEKAVNQLTNVPSLNEPTNPSNK